MAVSLPRTARRRRQRVSSDTAHGCRRAQAVPWRGFVVLHSGRHRVDAYALPNACAPQLARRPYRRSPSPPRRRRSSRLGDRKPGRRARRSRTPALRRSQRRRADPRAGSAGSTGRHRSVSLSCSGSSARVSHERHVRAAVYRRDGTATPIGKRPDVEHEATWQIHGLLEPGVLRANSQRLHRRNHAPARRP